MPGSYPSRRRAGVVVATLAGAFVIAVALFMTHDLRGSLAFALTLRAKKAAALSIVGCSLGVSTVLFHTMTHNRILTPGLIGFDSLYVLIQTAAAFVFGTFTVSGIDVRLRFAVELAILLGFALVLQRRVLARYQGDLILLVLVGIVVGSMFASVTALLGRMIDPNEFISLQDRLFASFATVNSDLLVVAGVVVVAALVLVARMASLLDVVALGRSNAVNLGVDHDRIEQHLLLLVALLVAVATALVGPLTFFGLIVANLGYRLTGTFRHGVTLPAAGLLGMTSLVAGQFVLERLLGSTTRLSIIVGLVGGVLFLVLLLRETATTSTAAIGAVSR